jgi:alpha-1,6-mannosyltransferase
MNLKKAISAMGIVNTIFYALYTVFSFGLFPRLLYAQKSAPFLEFSHSLEKSLNFLPLWLKSFQIIQYRFSEPRIWAIGYSVPLLVSTFATLYLLYKLSKTNINIEPSIPKQLFAWAIIFSLIICLAIPVLVLDFWYPIAWGRMVVNGINPYYTTLREMPGLINDLPMGQIAVKMMYGPLWAVTSGGIMGLAGGRLWLGAVALKILIFSLWNGSLWLIYMLLKDFPAWNQSVGILIFGWLPIGLIQSVGDGHNDIAMVFFILLWLYGLNQNWNIRARLSLIGSILIKYVSAPLLFFDFLHWYFQKGKRFWGYLVSLVFALFIGAAITGLFFRSIEMFEYLSDASTWHFYEPADAIRAIFDLLGLNIPGATLLARVFLASIFAIYLYQYLKKKEILTFWSAVLAMMVLILFAVNRHFWPWYLVWVLGLAALVSHSLIARWVVGVALLAPFPIVVWVAFPQLSDFYKFAIPSLVLYGFSLIWLLFVPSRWFPSSGSESFRIGDLKTIILRRFEIKKL